jgi:uncharacterized protein (TIRG00374 family)
MMTEQIRGRLFSRSNIIFYILSLGIIALVFFHFAELRSISRLFRNIEPIWLIVALLAQFGTYIALGGVYASLARIETALISLRPKDILRLSFMSVFLNHTIPSGGVSGSIFIFSSLTKRGLSHKEAASVVVTESITFYIAYLLIIISAGITFACAKHLSIPPALWLVLALGFIFFSILMIVVSFVGKGRLISSLIHKFHNSRLFALIFRPVEETPPEIVNLKNPWHILSTHTQRALEAIFFQLLLFFADTFTVFALFHGLHADVSLGVIFLAFVPTVIVGSLPLSPGSLLVYESGMTFFYTTLGVPFSAALVITLMYRALSFWLTIPLGLLLYRHTHNQKLLRGVHS